MYLWKGNNNDKMNLNVSRIDITFPVYIITEHNEQTGRWQQSHSNSQTTKSLICKFVQPYNKRSINGWNSTWCRGVYQKFKFLPQDIHSQLNQHWLKNLFNKYNYWLPIPAQKSIHDVYSTFPI